MDDNINKIIENEQEWRRYMVKRLDKIENDFILFKGKAFGFLSVLTVCFNLIFDYVKFKFGGK